MRGVITTSGFGWIAAGRDVDATVELSAIGTVVVARSSAITSAARNGNDVSIRFTATIPVIDTSEGRFSWNLQLETRSPKYRATFLIDVA